jgi:hypothetical protein
MIRALFIGIVITTAVSGCIHTNLDIGYDSTKAKRGPLSSVKSLKVEVGDFADKRPQMDRIGCIRNDIGGPVINLSASRPVSAIIHDAVEAALNKNGHTAVTGSEKDITMSGSIETFWFESQTNLSTIELMGTIDINLTVRDGCTDQVLFSKRYSGHHNIALLSGYKNDRADVMNAALAKLIFQIVCDPKLIGALNSFVASSRVGTQAGL